MAATPVMILGVKYPMKKEDIEKISKKLAKRTKDTSQIWPEGGTFDVSLCDNMKESINAYKPKDKSKKRQKKREKELGILELFKKEGERYRKAMRKYNEMKKEDKVSDEDKMKNEKIQLENQCAPSYLTSLYPLLKGALNISGDIDFEDKTPHSSPRPTLPDPPKYCSTNKKKQGRKENVLDCYANKDQALKNMTKKEGRSYWLDLQHRSPDDELEKTRAKAMEELQKLENEIFGHVKPGGSRESQGGVEDEGAVGGVDNGVDNGADNAQTQKRIRIHSHPEEPEERVVMGGNLTFAPKATDSRYDLRYRPNIHPPDKYTDPANQLPILIKGAQGQYIPWQTSDLGGLISRLPSIHEGAARWIRVFEEETVGKILALGDIKAVWARVLGIPTMESVFRASGFQWMAEPEADGVEFNPYRGDLWTTLRREYPIKVDTNALKGEPLSDTENPSEYISRQLKRWRQETEEEVHNSPLMTTLFRTSVVDAMPAPIKSRLEEVVGLTTKPHREFCEHVIHAIEKHRRDELRLKEQDKDIQRKVAQLQLSELTNKNKKKIQATVVEAPPGVEAVLASAPVPPNAPPANLPVPPPPVVNVFAPPPGADQVPPKRGQFQGGRRGGPRRRSQPSGPPPLQDPQCCWGCGQPGHNKQYCPNRPWPAPKWNKGGYGGWQPQQPNTGPINLWEGPNPSY